MEMNGVNYLYNIEGLTCAKYDQFEDCIRSSYSNSSFGEYVAPSSMGLA